MVFYFTGTGNSLYVAKNLDSKYISIAQAIHFENLKFKADKIGVICPIYGHEMPDLVKLFFKTAEFDTEYFYLILTYGNRHGGARELAEKFLDSIGKKANYINTLLMIDNFLPAFDMQKQVKTAYVKRIDENIKKIKSDLEVKKEWFSPVTETDRDAHCRFLRGPYNNITSDFLKNVYQITSDCIGCGICTRVCPVGCINLVDGRAVSSGENCQYCMACIHHCPKKAIKMNVFEVNPDARYHNGHIKLNEIVSANNQRK